MKIKIKQSKLVEILDYLSVDGLFSFSVITTAFDEKAKQHCLVSSQSGDYAYRYAKFFKDYFVELSEEKETIRIDIDKIRKFINYEKPDAVITLKYPAPKDETKLMLAVGKTKHKIAVTKFDDKDSSTSLPFAMKDNIPYMNKGQVPLDENFVIKLESVKKMTGYAAAHRTEFFGFKIGDDKKLKVRIGDLHATDDCTEYEPDCKVINTNGSLDIILTYGVKEIAKTFQGDVKVSMHSGMAAWFSEATKDHRFGILISPKNK